MKDGVESCTLTLTHIPSHTHTHISQAKTMIQTNHDGMQTPPGRENPWNREPNGELVLLWRLTSLIISPDDADGQPGLNEPWKCYNGQWERDPKQSNIITLGKLDLGFYSASSEGHLFIDHYILFKLNYVQYAILAQDKIKIFLLWFFSSLHIIFIVLCLPCLLVLE